jgi:hypothetical protein
VEDKQAQELNQQPNVLSRNVAAKGACEKHRAAAHKKEDYGY